MPLSSILRGDSFDAHEYLGAHPLPEGGWIFRVYAPHASRVTLEGDFSGWQELEPSGCDRGVYEFRIPWAKEGQKYKYCITSGRGVRTEKADPFAFSAEYSQGKASVLYDTGRISFQDAAWMEKRNTNEKSPLNIYEMHIRSWKRHHRLNWRKLAEELIPWLQRFQYTHVELLPVTEYPMEGSWGYQVTGFFAPTARYGTPGDFAAFVDAMHRAGIGVILDYVCVHFASDSVALRMFDGGAVFESRHPAQRRSDWGSILFDHSSGFVRSFLQSAAEQWLTRYHIDGLRFDAVSHLIYNKGNNELGENPAGIRFLQQINRGLRERHPSVMLIAEDSTLYPGTTRPLETWGGLGFHYKWDMGWTHDATAYLQLPPEQRPGNSRLLTLGIDHFDQAHWLLPFSHDDAAWKNLAERFSGSDEDKLAQSKLFLMFMMAHPGKKLMFMGTESGMMGEWRLSHGPDWQLDEHPLWLGFSFFTEDLCRLYRDNSAFWEADQQSWGARWLSCDSNGSGVYVLVRHSAQEHVLAVMNFSDSYQEQYFPLPNAIRIRLLLHSDRQEYAGHTANTNICAQIADGTCHIRLARYSGMLLSVQYA